MPLALGNHKVQQSVRPSMVVTTAIDDFCIEMPDQRCRLKLQIDRLAGEMRYADQRTIRLIPPAPLGQAPKFCVAVIRSVILQTIHELHIIARIRRPTGKRSASNILSAVHFNAGPDRRNILQLGFGIDIHDQAPKGIPNLRESSLKLTVATKLHSKATRPATKRTDSGHPKIKCCITEHPGDVESH